MLAAALPAAHHIRAASRRDAKPWEDGNENQKRDLSEFAVCLPA
jgi:hypothetical protein